MVLYAFTTFLSAFLLFQVQPLIGKYILPWFGGGLAVWTTCMLFFQVLLLAGYAATHFLSVRLSPQRHGWVQLILLGCALLFLPIGPRPEVWKPSSPEFPAGRILLLLLVNVGVPYFLLSATSPLIQKWFAFSFPRRSPYRLYALSNAGSLLALLTYPFLFEPSLTVEKQTAAWSICFAFFVVLCGACAVRIVRAPNTPGTENASAPAPPASGGDAEDPRSRAPGLGVIALWVALAACGSAMLLATTNQLCQEVAVVPFLWVLPLSLYLLTFVICFDREGIYDRRWFGPLLILAAPAAYYTLREGVEIDMPVQIIVYSSTLFICCMHCHGELVRAKPHPRYLTLFYLAVAAGGAVGGFFVAIVAPAVFVGFWEYHVALAGTCLLTVFCWLRGTRGIVRPLLLLFPLAASLVLVAALFNLAAKKDEDVIFRTRNFYGVLRVTQYWDGDGLVRSLRHGRILHGNQYIDSEKSRWATTYYGPETGIGLALTYHPRRTAGTGTLRVGVVGLGTGTIAAYGRPGDYFRFYEINPAVERISNEFFTYRRDSSAEVDVVLGDARVSMEQELARGERQNFDVLAVDAFSSDSIPVHLLTEESGRIYLQHLKTDGLLLLHISNRFLNLDPVARGMAEALGRRAVMIDSDEDASRGVDAATWVILTNNEKFLSESVIRQAVTPWPEDDPAPILWTDGFAGLWQVLKWDFGVPLLEKEE